MKPHKKSTKSINPVVKLQHQKPSKKNTSQIKAEHISMNTVYKDRKKVRINSNNCRQSDHMNSIRYQSISKHHLSQSQLHKINIQSDNIGNNKQMKSQHHSKQHHSKKIKQQKQGQQIKHNLLRTFKILQNRLKLQGSDSSQLTTLGLSKSVYQMVRKSAFEIQLKKKGCQNQITMNSFNNSGAQLLKYHEGSKIQRKNREQKNYNKHSNSILEYFEQKFGDNNDEKVRDSLSQQQENLQKKFKILQALKRSQQIATKCSSKYSSSIHSGYSQIRGKDEVKQIVREKTKKCEI